MRTPHFSKTVIRVALALGFALVLCANASAQHGSDSVLVSAEATTDEEACAERFATTIQRHYDAVSDFAARFEQRTRSVTLGNTSLGADAPSSGTVQFRKPGKMRWRYEWPTASEVISDGKILWLVDEVTKEAQRLPVTEGYLTGAALEFLLGDGKILEEFDVKAASCAPGEDGAVALQLLPREAASYQSLDLLADPASGEIRATGLIDLFGNRTDIRFRDARTNLNPDPRVFTFEPPDGIRVIDLITNP